MLTRTKAPKGDAEAVSEKTKLSMGEWVAILIATSFVLFILIVPLFRIIAEAVCRQTSNHICEKIDQWIRKPSITDWFLVFVGCGQLLVFGKQMFISRVQADIMRQQAETLPRIERAYVFATVSLGSKVESRPRNNVCVHAAIRFTNYGKTPAIIRAVNVRLEARKLPPSAIVDADIEIPESLVIAQGTNYDVTLRSTIPAGTWASVDLPPTETLYCFGAIRYQDILKADYTTGFCWRYLPLDDDERFVVTPDTPLNFFT